MSTINNRNQSKTQDHHQDSKTNQLCELQIGLTQKNLGPYKTIILTKIFK